MAIRDILNEDDSIKIIKRGMIGVGQTKQPTPLVQKDVVMISNSMTSLQNAFNKIYTYSTNIKSVDKFNERRLQSISRENALEGGSPISIESPSVADDQSSNMSVASVAATFDELGTAIEDLTQKIKDRPTGGSGIGDAAAVGLPALLGMTKFGKKLLGPAGIAFDAFGRYSEGQSAGQIAVGVGGGLAGAALGAKGGAAVGGAIGAAFAGVGAAPGAAIGGFIGGVGGYFAGSSVGDKAYQSFEQRAAGGPVRSGGTYVVGERGPEVLVMNGQAGRVLSNGTKVSSKVEKELGDVVAKASKTQARLESAKPLSETSYSSKFVNYLREVYQNVTSWVSRAGDFLSRVFSRGPGAGTGGDLLPNEGVLDAIAKAEGTYTTGYNTSLGYGEFLPGGKEQNLTEMSLQEILDLGDYMRRQRGNPNSSALGRYQIVGTTLRDGAKALGMDLNTTKFDPATQDRLAMWIVRNQGFRAWEGFKRNPDYLTAAQDALAQGNIGGRGTPSGGRYRINSAFGMRRHPVSGEQRMHSGVDVAAPAGTSVHAFRDGVVEQADTIGGYGNVVYINHKDGTQTRYAHLSSISTRAGANVKQGDMVGRVGSTGTSTGNHLHFEVLNSQKQKIDPTGTYNSNPWIVGGDTTAKAITPPIVPKGYRRSGDTILIPSRYGIPLSATRPAEVPNYANLPRTAQREIEAYFLAQR